MTLENLHFFFWLSCVPLGRSKQHLIAVIVHAETEADVMASHVAFYRHTKA